MCYRSRLIYNKITEDIVALSKRCYKNVKYYEACNRMCFESNQP